MRLYRLRAFLRRNGGKLSLLLLGTGVASGCRSPEPPQPNVAVILIDTLRASYLELYGYPEETAPFLNAMSQRSAVFDRAFSTSSWTVPSTASLFTSLYPDQHGVVEGFFMLRRRNNRLREAGKETVELTRLPASIATLPERFQSMGYATFGLATNVHIDEPMSFHRGFDRFENHPKDPASSILDRLRAWKTEIRGTKPFFLYLHLNDAHWPYEERLPYYQRQEDDLADRRARYLGEVSYVDEYIRKIHDELALHENTILVFLSDHGEEFLDHGGYAHETHLYDELNRILMMFHAPFLGIEPARIDANVSLVDVLPTLLELTGGEPFDSAEGTSLVPILRNESGREELLQNLRRRILFAHRVMKNTPEPFWGAILRHWKLIERPDSEREAYDHRTDPDERRNVYSRDPNQVPARLRAALDRFKARPAFQSEHNLVEVDEELREHLEALGYVQ